MPSPTKQPWSRAEATRNIQALARSPDLRLTYTEHAKTRIFERDLTIGDVLRVLKEGFVHRDPEASTQAGLYKYHPEGRSPNSGNRVVRVVVIPDPTKSWMKIVTVMWVDEP
ncbi:MAG: DUF4258 domain-containing protein [Siculibacillus sp.]|nr:DUF4258 domain-containing protein [Siculibacillus sp.]